jgi:hypothetical protein
VEKIGKGGMGEVFRVKDQKLDRDVYDQAESPPLKPVIP